MLFTWYCPFGSVLAKRFGDANLRDNLIQAAVLGNGLADSAISGRMYNRGIHFYKPAYEAFQTLLLENMESIYEADAWTNLLYLMQKRSWPTSLKIYQHPTTLNTKIPGNFRPTTDSFLTKKIILQKTQEIWQTFYWPFWIWWTLYLTWYMLPDAGIKIST